MIIPFSNCFIFASLSCKKSGQTVRLPTGRLESNQLLSSTNSTANFFYLHNLLDTAYPKEKAFNDVASFVEFSIKLM